LTRAFLGLGSNEPGRRAYLWAARNALATRAVETMATSPLYETAPQGEILDQPDFLNGCLEVETDLEPLELLDACKAVEHELGRERGGPRHGPRPIDVDVLLYGGLEWSDDRLTLPHPEITSRRFVLAPLLDLAPDLALPDGTALAPLLDSLADQRVDPAGSLDDGLQLTLARYELAALPGGTAEVIRHHYTEDVVVHQDPSFPDAAAIVGRAAALELLAGFTESLGEPRLEARRAAVNADLVVVEVALAGKGPASGVPLDWTGLHVTRLRDGYVAALHIFLDAAEALAFAGIAAGSLDPV
jgi:2-amino-4-hydroxy-6-hydroxymethyldihydropteridine diphosphokinase